MNGGSVKTDTTAENRSSDLDDKKDVDSAEPADDETGTQNPDVTTDATETDTKEAEPSWRRRAFRFLTGPDAIKVIVVVILIGAIVTAGLQWYRADKADTRQQDRRQVGDSAGRFGQALLSYDHTRLQAARNKVLSLSSNDFAKTYDQAFTGGLEGIITKLKADATATVRTVYVGDVDGGNASAVVVMDSEVHSTAGTRSVLGSYLDMKLTRSHGEWKVTEVTSIGAANESMTDPNGKQETAPAQPDPSPGG
jgi:Mce-associated membrane protein